MIEELFKRSSDARLKPLLGEAMSYRDHGLPFGLVRLPASGNESGQWLLAGKNEDASQFSLRVRGWMTSNYLDFGNPNTYFLSPQQVCRQSITREFYDRQVRHAVGVLQDRGGKTVLSRTICGDFAEPLNANSLADMAETFFSTEDARRKLSFLFWHPNTGFWMGATPELVLEDDGAQLRTMALAGTMPAGFAGPWSLKNVKEHEIVADYLEHKLEVSPFEFKRSKLCCVSAGNVVHLCTHFSAPIPNFIHQEVFDSIVDALEPTPALAGFPRNFALNDITVLEPYHRYFYAGIISVATPRKRVTYGMIRCVHFDDRSWCVYSGGGLTADSNADEEWRETKLKAAPLVDLLSNK